MTIKEVSVCHHFNLVWHQHLGATVWFIYHTERLSVGPSEIVTVTGCVGVSAHNGLYRKQPKQWTKCNQ